MDSANNSGEFDYREFLHPIQENSSESSPSSLKSILSMYCTRFNLLKWTKNIPDECMPKRPLSSHLAAETFAEYIIQKKSQGFCLLYKSYTRKYDICQ